MKTTRNITMTKKYLKENNLLAIPFDKGIRMCMFEEVVTVRKNAKHPVQKEEERIVNILKQLHKDNEISEAMFKRLKANLSGLRPGKGS